MKQNLMMMVLLFVPMLMGMEANKAPRFDSNFYEPITLVPSYEMPVSFSAESIYVHDLTVTGTWGSVDLQRAGGMMSGDINMGMNDITHVDSIIANFFVIPVTSSSTVGVITQNGVPLLQTYGSDNLFLGAGSGDYTLSGSQNISIGEDSSFNVSSGTHNIAIGIHALSTNHTSSNNIAIGLNALLRNYVADNNSALGIRSLQENRSGDNTAVGYRALFLNIAGYGNTAAGKDSLLNNDQGSINSCFGCNALKSNVNGHENIAVGYNAGALITGDQNTCIGSQSGSYVVDGASNIMIGYNAGSGVSTASDVIVIGDIAGTDVSSRTYIANIRDVTTGVGDALNVVIDSNGQLGTLASSRRFKENIVDVGAYSEKLYDVRPVIFTYKTDDEHRPQYGLIAQEVQEVMPELIVNDNNGQIYTIMYQNIPPLMLNELQKLHTCIQQQQYRIALQRKIINKLQDEFKKPFKKV